MKVLIYFAPSHFPGFIALVGPAATGYPKVGIPDSIFKSQKNIEFIFLHFPKDGAIRFNSF